MARLNRLTPQAVAFPTSVEEVAQIARICTAHQVPIVPFGTGYWGPPLRLGAPSEIALLTLSQAGSA